MKNLILIALTFLMLAPSVSKAGEGGHGGSGGDGYMCAKPKDDPTYPPYNLRLVDTYGHEELDEIVQDNEGQLMDPWGIRTIGRFLDRKMPAKTHPHPYKPGVKITFGQVILLRYHQLYFFHSDRAPLPDIKDDNIWWWQIPRGCKKVQLAIQDTKTSVVRMSDLMMNLPLIDDVFLRLHEILISIRNQPGYDTTPVRRDVERLAAMIRDHRAELVKGITTDYEKQFELIDKAPVLTMPKTLRCSTTWKMPRIDAYQPKFEIPSSFIMTRVKGSGQSTDKNVYQFSLGTAAPVSYETNNMLQPTVHATTIALEINAFETKFEMPRGVTYKVGMYDFIPELGVYTGDIQGSYTDKNISSKSKQISSHEMYNGAGLICVPQ